MQLQENERRLEGMSGKLNPIISEVDSTANRNMIALSVKKKYHSPNFFTASNPSDHSSHFFRQKKPDDTDKIQQIKVKPYIAPELKKYRNAPDQLPAFLREKLVADNQKAKASMPSLHADDIMYLTPSRQERAQSFEESRKRITDAIGSHRKLDKEINILYESLKDGNLLRTASKKPEIIEYRYLSPKARIQTKQECPPLLSNVFLTGMINPEVLTHGGEAMIEHIITDHHPKREERDPNSYTKPKVEDDKKKRVGMKKSVLASNFSNLNKIKEENEKNSKISAELQEELAKRLTEEAKDQRKIFTYGDDSGTQGSERFKPYTEEKPIRVDSTGSEDFLRFMQDHDLRRNISPEKKFKVEPSIDEDVNKLKEERKDRRKMMLKLFKTKNFNLFKPTTINNMHLLKDAFKKSKIPYPY